MHIGMVGLGKMGRGMSERLRRKDHEVTGYDTDPEISDVESLEALVEALPSPKVVWVMVPAGDPTAKTLKQLGDLCGEGDLVVDGGNSSWKETLEHAEAMQERGVQFADCGVSGGVWGLENGYGLMAGGTDEAIELLQPALDALAPEDGGFVHAGPVGAGHFVKMVHNGIEYGLMQAYGEGYELLEASDLVQDIPGVIQAWRYGTVIRSWLLDLMGRALDEDADLSELRGYAQDSGEGRWTVQTGIDLAVPTPVISAALFARFTSRQEESPAMKVVAALRNQFGGHSVQSSAGEEGKGADAPGADTDDSADDGTGGSGVD